MHVSFDAQPLIAGQKTGVGFCEAGMIRALASLYPEPRYALDFFSFRHRQAKLDTLEPFTRQGLALNECAWFPGTVYRAACSLTPLPYRLFLGGKAQITHFFNFLLPPGVAGKRITTVHDMAFRAFPETVRLKTRTMLQVSLEKSCKRAHRIMVVSEFTRQELIKYMNVPADKIFVAYNGVDTGVFYPRTDPQALQRTRDKYGIPDSYFLYLGTLEPRKNIERLIEAYAALRSKRPDCPVLVLAGRKGWLYNTIFQRVAQLHLEERVLFTGYVEDGDAPFLLSGAHAFLFPSLYEGFGMPPLEAMACGVPVLTANTSSLPEVVGDAALLVDPYDVDSILFGMERLLDDEQLRRDLAEKGRARAALFTWEASAHTVMGVYRDLLEKG